MALLGGVAFVAFTARAPSVAAVKASYLLPLAVPAAAFFARGVDSLGGLARSLALAGSTVAALSAAVLFANGVVFSMHVDRSVGAPAWMSQGLAEAAAELGGASEGRWSNVEAAEAAGGEILWRLVAHHHPKLSDAKVAIWCGYVANAMASRAPGRLWHAVVTQRDDVRPCASPSSVP